MRLVADAEPAASGAGDQAINFGLLEELALSAFARIDHAGGSGGSATDRLRPLAAPGGRQELRCQRLISIAGVMVVTG